ncbi:pyroglutamyl-peptidase I [Virgibacillus sp. 179-BFC.A HS]|uniref:Pyroglutamyl-peptidase I n=1 Tax=Tigheibacillus jepli TaxID=3035914 RepID=A0ABU5CFH3_9BACI|nr:pyroglutamyl-peptidase I [Virgibacillus sp. 179-BFC.A HS]MDY0405058.1 pyroglutamyl-peptidase I [Virgibacillus sp. 179-BFC.A HS]
MKKLLVTGFEPFLDNPINPTAEIAEKLNDTVINDYAIIGKVLPVVFSESGEQLVKLLEAHQPDALISLGLAAGRNCVTPERIAINCNDGPKDNRGNEPNGERIVPDGPDGYFSTLPIQKMVSCMEKEGLPAVISNSAGTYLCNHVMYQGLHYFKVHKLERPSGFIHLPASHALAIRKKMPSWSADDLCHAVKIAIACL